MNKRILILAIISIFIFSILPISASIETLPPVKQGDCTNLVQIYANSSYQNVTYILIQNSNLTLSNININKAMTQSGSFFNYTFCNTSILGHYIVNGIGDFDGASRAWVYDFYVNGSGQEISQSQINLIIIGIIVLIIVAVFFFILAVLFKHPGTKIFLMAMSGGTVILLIGLIASNAALYLAEFTGLVAIYDKFYILIMTLAGVCVLGIVIWLIYYATTLFSKIRGRSVDDD